MFFNESAFCELEKKVMAGDTADSRDDRETLEEIMLSFQAYVDTVVRGEIGIKIQARGMEGQEYRDLISDYDGRRHTCHETAISNTKLLNRLAAFYQTDSVYTGDEDQRHQVADFCLEFVSWIFRNRMKKLS